MNKYNQLNKTLKLINMIKENQYDLVIGNPPYLGSGKMENKEYIEKHYKEGKADLYAAFLMRGLQLCKKGGYSALLTMRGWMFISQYTKLRELLLNNYGLAKLGDLDRGAFSEIAAGPGGVTVTASIFKNFGKTNNSTAIRTTPATDIGGVGITERKRAGLQCQAERFTFDVQALKGIEGWPLVYWWYEAFLQRYLDAPKLGDETAVRKGLCTGDNTRFLRKPWEVSIDKIFQSKFDEESSIYPTRNKWVPFIKGAAGKAWFEPLSNVIYWREHGFQLHVWIELYRTRSPGQYIKNEQYYFQKGIAFSTIGANFSARIHRFSSIFGARGSSVFPSNIAQTLCLMNSKNARYVVESLNPGINFVSGDVKRLPIMSIQNSDNIIEKLEQSFSMHEKHKENSMEYNKPGKSSWNHTQEWAKKSVDRNENDSLPPFEPVYEEEPATDHISYAVGVALGRFGSNGEGILDPNKDDISKTLPHGILFLNGTLDETEKYDSLGHESSKILNDTWKEKGSDINKRLDLRTYLRTKFFGDVHLKMYEKRPIHWPLTSANKTFVAYLTIHRMNGQTLRNLQAFHLAPSRETLEKKLQSLLETKSSGDEKAAKKAEKEYATAQKALEELNDFIDMVQQCGEHGPPPIDGKCPSRAVDALYDPDLDDGVMINSAALWPLLHPQWKDPKKWWKEMSTAKGKKDYDWAHLAKKYWPERVEEKCKQDPSLGVAHGCFWKYHPERAWAWELRLQQEIGPDFTIDEEGSNEYRYHYLIGQSDASIEAIEKEVLRRKKKLEEPQRSLTLNRPGLWKYHPEKMWTLEEKLMNKMGYPFRLEAPDAKEGRERFLREHPEIHKQRDGLLEKKTPKQKELV